MTCKHCVPAPRPLRGAVIGATSVRLVNPWDFTA